MRGVFVRRSGRFALVPVAVLFGILGQVNLANAATSTTDPSVVFTTYQAVKGGCDALFDVGNGARATAVAHFTVAVNGVAAAPVTRAPGVTDAEGYGLNDRVANTVVFTEKVSGKVFSFPLTPRCTVKAVNDAASTQQGTPVVVSVLANDSPDFLNHISVESVGTPGHGTAVLQPNGTIKYTPAADFSGTDSFTYVVTGGNGTRSTATVTVTVTPKHQPKPTLSIKVNCAPANTEVGSVDTTTHNSADKDVTVKLAVVDGQGVTVLTTDPFVVAAGQSANRTFDQLSPNNGPFAIQLFVVRGEVSVKVDQMSADVQNCSTPAPTPTPTSTSTHPSPTVVPSTSPAAGGRNTSSEGQLPNTGTSVRPLLGLAVVLLTGGSLALFAGRRRRGRFTAI